MQNKKSPEIEEMIKDADSFATLDALAVSEGGKILIKSLKTDIISSILSLVKYKTASHVELIATCATLTERLNILKVLTRAKINKDGLLKELSEILEE